MIALLKTAVRVAVYSLALIEQQSTGMGLNLVGLINILFHWEHPVAGYLLYDDIGELLVPRWGYADVPALERPIVPGSQARVLAAADLSAWEANGNSAPVLYLHADTPDQFAFDTPLRDWPSRRTSRRPCSMPSGWSTGPQRCRPKGRAGRCGWPSARCRWGWPDSPWRARSRVIGRR